MIVVALALAFCLPRWLSIGRRLCEFDTRLTHKWTVIWMFIVCNRRRTSPEKSLPAQIRTHERPVKKVESNWSYRAILMVIFGNLYTSSCLAGSAKPFLVEFSKFRIRPILADQKWSAILFYLREIRLNPAIPSVPIQYTTSMLLNSTWLRPSHRNVYYLLAIIECFFRLSIIFLVRSKYAHHL